MPEIGSFIGWIDFSEEDQKRARDYLRALDSGTIDELGFGIMRDAFSNVFFPATSTIMTHARFYIFVPVICRYVESEGLSGEKARRKTTQMEQHLRKLLAEGSHINIRQETVKRYPSSIYWNGLKELRIFRFDWSQKFYFDHIFDYHLSRKTIVDDDKMYHYEDRCYEHWDAELIRLYNGGGTVEISEKGSFDDDTGIDLTYGEARFLRSRFRELAGRKGPSLMSCLLTKEVPEVPEKFDYPWECSIQEDSEYIESLKNLVDHAEKFSMITKGATIIYYDMLVKKRISEDLPSPQNDLSEYFKMWWDMSRDKLFSWNLDKFIDQMHERGAVRWGDDTFLRQFLQLLLDMDGGEKFFYYEKTRMLVRERELKKRPHKSRLKYKKYLMQWELEQVKQHLENNSPYWLNYRADIASRFVKQIAAGIRREDWRDA